MLSMIFAIFVLNESKFQCTDAIDESSSNDVNDLCDLVLSKPKFHCTDALDESSSNVVNDLRDLVLSEPVWGKIKRKLHFELFSYKQ